MLQEADVLAPLHCERLVEVRPTSNAWPREKTLGTRQVADLALRGPRRSSQRGPATGTGLRSGGASTQPAAGPAGIGRTVKNAFDMADGW